MRRNSSTVVVLAGPAPDEVLAAVGRSMNVTLIRPDDPDGDGNGLAAAAEALRRAGRATSPYALVAADPLAAVAVSWQAMWDVSRQHGPAGFEQEAAKALTAWRAGLFELPDYYLVLAAGPGQTRPGRTRPGENRAGERRAGEGRPGENRAGDRSGGGRSGQGRAGERRAGESQAGHLEPDFYLGPLRSARPHRVAVVAATEPSEQAAGVLHALGSLRHGPWWPGLDEVIETARRFYPGSLAESRAALVGDQADLRTNQ
jgi:hypothetical protein